MHIILVAAQQKECGCSGESAEWIHWVVAWIGGLWLWGVIGKAGLESPEQMRLTDNLDEVYKIIRGRDKEDSDLFYPRVLHHKQEVINLM